MSAEARRSLGSPLRSLPSAGATPAPVQVLRGEHFCIEMVVVMLLLASCGTASTSESIRVTLESELRPGVDVTFVDVTLTTPEAPEAVLGHDARVLTGSSDLAHGVVVANFDEITRDVQLHVRMQRGTDVVLVSDLARPIGGVTEVQLTLTPCGTDLCLACAPAPCGEADAGALDAGR